MPYQPGCNTSKKSELDGEHGTQDFESEDGEEDEPKKTGNCFPKTWKAFYFAIMDISEGERDPANNEIVVEKGIVPHTRSGAKTLDDFLKALVSFGFEHIEAALKDIPGGDGGWRRCRAAILDLFEQKDRFEKRQMTASEIRAIICGKEAVAAEAGAEVEAEPESEAAPDGPTGAAAAAGAAESSVLPASEMKTAREWDAERIEGVKIESWCDFVSGLKEHSGLSDVGALITKEQFLAARAGATCSVPRGTRLAALRPVAQDTAPPDQGPVVRLRRRMKQ